MPEHPPPAPDWILGEDGHWKPPPFVVGGRPTAPPPAAPGPVGGPPVAGPPVGGPPPGGAPPPGAWPPPPGGPAPGWVPPPSTGPSPGRIVAMVVGGLAVAGIAVVGILVTAVTFLGTTSEPRFTAVGSSLPAADPAANPVDVPEDGATPIGPPEDESVLSESALTTERIFDALGAGWIVTGAEAPPVDESRVGACIPDGWLGEATDRFRTYYDRPGGPVTDALTLSLTTYASEEAAQAELARARSQVYADCLVEEQVALHPTATDATTTALPEDPRAPGVTYQVDLIGPDPLVEYELTVVVGRQRAHLDFCGCADLGLEGQQEVARTVAAAMAEAQGVPVPGR